jgi:hypothetical protein
MIPSFLLPSDLPLNPSSIRLEGQCLLIEASAYQPYSICPVCGHRNARVHSKYIRMLADLPTSGYHVKVTVLSRKYFCDNPDCLRKVFTERFNQEIIPYHRRFSRQQNLLANIALELGGNKGAAISRLSAMPVSASTILRIIKRMNLRIQKMTSGILGIDDWAFKKGNTYGTIIVDLKKNKVVDLLCDRQSETLRLWLQGHPEVEVVSRDRGGPYAKGAREGAPQAIQVADRFHLLMNLGEATKRMFQSLGGDLKEVHMLYHSRGQQIDSVAPVKGLESGHPKVIPIEVHSKNPARQLRFDKIKELHSQGHAIRAIARSLHLQRSTVRSYLRMDSLPKKRGFKSTNFESFQFFLLHEDNRTKTYMVLYEIIKARGFCGRYSQFCNNMNGLLRSHDIIPASCKLDPTPLRTWSPRQLSALIQKDTNDLKREDREFLELLNNRCPVVQETKEYIFRFKKLFKTKQKGTL